MKGGSNASEKGGGDIDNGGRPRERLEEVLTSQLKWTKLIACLLGLVIALLTVIASILLLQLPRSAEEKLYSSDAAASFASGFNADTGEGMQRESSAGSGDGIRVKRSGWPWVDGTPKWYASIEENVGPGTNVRGVFYLITKFDQLLNLTQNILTKLDQNIFSVRVVNQQQQRNGNHSTEAPNDADAAVDESSHKHLDVGAIAHAEHSTSSNVKPQLEALTNVTRDIGATLDNVWNRMIRNDYRHPNFTCPDWNRGDFQYVGPDGFYSTCYYLDSSA